ncbi:zinc finger protein 568-like [Lutzomyia longipalpis]|uniref:zinc finger protein 568-like n=1 Tax=Lutzomyia longipalpis TaxID=7200 RepID=UPI002483E358|nr:zinc finger protein 568-like [Lutzomyia longipalpis]
MELLYDSKICRLCGENNAIGYELFGQGDAQISSRVSGLINHYLPVKVKNDGKFPRWICPGCNIQVEATVEFFDLIIRGQEKLRELYREELANQEQHESSLEIAPATDPELPEETGLFPSSHTLSLQVQGVEKPRKKRGRPPKPPQDVLEAQRLRAEAEYLAEQRRKEAQELKEQEESNGRRKRRVKIPERFRSVVQGKELEKVYVAQGVIDKTDISDTDEGAAVSIIENTTDDGRGSQVIGHLKSADGAVLSDLVVTQKTEFHRKGRVARLKMRFVCDVCSKTFSHELRFLTHRATHQNVRYECTECLQRFLTKELLKEHHATSGHNGQGIVESVETSTEHSGQDSNAIDAARALYDLQQDTMIQRGGVADGSGDGPAAVKGGGDPLGTEMAQIAEIADNFMNIPGLEEGEEGTFEGDILAGYNMSQPDATVETQATFVATKKFICSLCKMAFTFMHELRVHMESHRVPQNFHCNVCQRRFNDPSVVALHKMAEHSNARRFACNRCDKHFMLKNQLQRHQNVHIVVRPFECGVCKKRFKTRPQLQYHAMCHSQEKRYGCDVCGQRFFYSGTLKHHYKRHTGHRPYKCTHCGKSFLQESILREHVRIHTGERPYKCGHCEMAFKTATQCRMHTQRHTNERPWACDLCGKAFLKLESYKIHMRRHRNEKIFVCDVCQRGFAEQYALKKHVRMHTGERPFRCGKCGKSFADRSNMVKHIKQLHAEEATPDTAARDQPNEAQSGSVEVGAPIVYQIVPNHTIDTAPIIFVTLPRKDQHGMGAYEVQDASVEHSAEEEILTMQQNIEEDPTNEIFLQLDAGEDYRYLLTDK